VRRRVGAEGFHHPSGQRSRTAVPESRLVDPRHRYDLAGGARQEGLVGGEQLLEAQRKTRETGMSEEEAEMAAFELNAQDAARVGGK